MESRVGGLYERPPEEPHSPPEGGERRATNPNHGGPAPHTKNEKI